MKCGKCGSNKFLRENVRGCFYPWKDYYQVRLEVDFDADVCQNCNEVKLKYRDYERLDKALVESINITQSKCIKTLAELGVNQKQLAAAMGVTPQYVSEAKNGKKQLSFNLFNQLQIFADSPWMIEEYTMVEVNIEKRHRFLDFSEKYEEEYELDNSIYISEDQLTIYASELLSALGNKRLPDHNVHIEKSNKVLHFGQYQSSHRRTGT